MVKDLSSNEQSYFSTDQEQIQPPPEYQAGTLQGESYRQKRRQRNRIIAIAAAVFAFVVLMVILIALFSNQNPPTEAEPTPIPLPTSAPSALENELKRLETVITAASPEQNLLPPPAVDMELSF